MATEAALSARLHLPMSLLHLVPPGVRATHALALWCRDSVQPFVDGRKPGVCKPFALSDVWQQTARTKETPWRE